MTLIKRLQLVTAAQSIVSAQKNIVLMVAFILYPMIIPVSISVMRLEMMRAPETDS